MAKQAPNRAKAETLSLRISPDLKFGLELLAKIEERSLTTEVEKALKELFGNTRIDVSYLDIENNGRIPELYFDYLLEAIYSPDAPTRLIRTAVAFPYLLSQRERVIIELISRDPDETFAGDDWQFFALAPEYSELQNDLDERFRREHYAFNMSRIRKNWSLLNDAAEFTLENGHYPHEFHWLI